MSIVHRLLLFAALIVSISTTSCDTPPTGPGSGSGNLLEATVDGTALVYLLSSGFQTYSDTLARIGGATTSSGSTHALTATFLSDLDKGTYPRVLGDNQITITYTITPSGGIPDSYDCFEHPDRCSITLTSRSGQIVDGTFSARLTNRNDTTKHVEITDGAFSVKLENK